MLDWIGDFCFSGCPYWYTGEINSVVFHQDVYISIIFSDPMTKV